MRKKKKEYEKIETSGAVSSVNMMDSLICQGSSTEDGGMMMSPYSDYIPLTYLLTSNRTNRWYNNSHIEGYYNRLNMAKGNNVDRVEGKIIKQMLYNAFQQDGKGEAALQALYSVREWMEYDIPISMNYMSRCIYYARSRESIGESILSPMKISQRSYTAMSHMYSLSELKNEEAIPHVLAVVLPENYLYLKYKLLVDNTLDMSKVIILINKNMDTPQFECKPFRKLYRDFLKPKIEETACDVWKVPLDYIVSSCFMRGYSLMNLGMKERRVISQSLIDGFKESIKSEGTVIDDETTVPSEFEVRLSAESYFGELPQPTVNTPGLTYLGEAPISNTNMVGYLAGLTTATENLSYLHNSRPEIEEEVERVFWSVQQV